MKKVIAAMTVGKDVSSLFPAVVNCVQTDNLELKKLVYLYLINYAKTQPDLALMAVNTFVKDASDPSPLIRALAVRTMGCIRVDKITEYLCDPLARALKDDDPYVRKTAAICVAKLYDISPELVEERGFLDVLKAMIGDANPMVVANAVASLAEIDGMAAQPVFSISSHNLFKLLAALNECTEWGQVFILDSMALYRAQDSKEAVSMIERVTPRLQHANCAVVLSAVKVIIQQLGGVQDADFKAVIGKKLAPPLVSLLSAEKEIQYVALRNINLIVQRYPGILTHEIKVFFCKYNDPIYVKMEKLEIMIRLANLDNIDQVLLEFKEYASEVDVEFVRKAVRAIGRCAVSLEPAAQRCIDKLLELITTRVNYVVQESIIVIKDIFRRYPNQYESIISTLCENLDTLDQPEAKASMIWIIGEYADRIDNADELLESFLDSFPEETNAVQLQLLTATVKLFLKKPTEGPQRMIQLVLSNATHETDNPDLRDRAYIYWRLLSSDPEAAKDIVLAQRPVIADDAASLEPSLLTELLNNVAMLSSVYHKPPDAFIARSRPQVRHVDADALGPLDALPGPAGDAGAGAAPGGGGNLLGGGLDDLIAGPVAPAAPAPAVPAAGGGGDLLGDLLSLDAPAAPAPTALADPFGGADLLGAAAPAPAPVPAAPAEPVLLTTANGKGVQVTGGLRREGGQVVYGLTFTNGGAVPLNGFLIQFNKNAFGLVPQGQLQVPPLPPTGSGAARLPITFNPASVSQPFSTQLQCAIKNVTTGEVCYFTDQVPLGAVATEDGNLDQGVFLQTWQGLPDTTEQKAAVPGTLQAPDGLVAQLQRQNAFLVANRPNPAGRSLLYFACKVAPFGAQLLFEVAYSPGVPGVNVCCKGPRPELAALVFAAVRAACT